MKLSRETLQYLNGHLVVFLAQWIWAGFSVITKNANKTFDVFIFSWFRLLGAAIVLIVMAIISTKAKGTPFWPKKKHLIYLGAYAFTGGFFNQISCQLGLLYLPASTMAMFGRPFSLCLARMHSFFFLLVSDLQARSAPSRPCCLRYACDRRASRGSACWPSHLPWLAPASC